ncbi:MULTISPECIES: DUF3231 family protein [Rossellomorea]|uniref:DUF3231 family protein n=1 Tax=Rossellomorea sp. y25 TaxID=3118174 RepID=UPI002608AC65|nr:DUF3231 family protein [Rossellomorea aquimaris]WRP07384.1 DUF3231 family protein [Rossellomorea aquimaris]
MEISHHKTKISSSELANLWTQYVNDSLARCMFRHFLHYVQDTDIIQVLEYALELTERHLQKAGEFLTTEGYPIPKGFTDEDVTIDAPPLFSDTYIIVYLHIMAIHGLTRYAGAIGNVTREDQREYFIGVMTETLELYDRSTKVLTHKGIISKPPSLNNHQKVEFIKKQNFLTGWLGKRRPISAVEISGTYLNLQKTMVKTVLELGFSQVAESKEVRNYMERARQLCNDHFKVLSSMLIEDNLHVPRTYETEVTDSTTPPFSDKLMLFHVTALLSSAIGYYGEAMGISQRRDLAASYAKMIAEIGLLAEDGMNLLIENEWMEQPPLATDHNDLAKNK